MATRTETLNGLLQKTRIELHDRKSIRDLALADLSHSPHDPKLLGALTTAAAAVTPLLETERQLESALEAAARHDAADAIAGIKDRAIDARHKAVAAARARKPIAAKIDKWIAAGAALLDELSESEQGIQACIAEATRGLEIPNSHGWTDQSYLGSLIQRASMSASGQLPGAFAAALSDAGLGTKGIITPGIELHINALHKRLSLVDAVALSADTLAYCLDDVHKRCGLVTVDPYAEDLDEPDPPIKPPIEVEAPDGSIHTYDVAETTWGDKL